jgi:hypothetical protein
MMALNQPLTSPNPGRIDVYANQEGTHITVGAAPDRRVWLVAQAGDYTTLNFNTSATGPVLPAGARVAARISTGRPVHLRKAHTQTVAERPKLLRNVPVIAKMAVGEMSVWLGCSDK